MSGAQPPILPKKAVYTCSSCSSDIEVTLTNGLSPPSVKCAKCGFELFFPVVQPQQTQTGQWTLKEQEAQLSEHLETFTKWLKRAWKKSGTLGKLFILAMFIGMTLPFIIGTLAIVIVYWWVVPIATSLTDRVLVFGVLFSLLTAIAIKVGETANQILYGAYLTRRMRNPERILPS